MTIDIATLKPGCYRLTQPIENPRPDRRSKDWCNLPEIPAGLYFVQVRDERREPSGRMLRDVRFDRVGEHRYARASSACYRSADDGATWELRSSSDSLAHAMLTSGALEHDDSLAALLRFSEYESYLKCRDVLVRLVEAGVVSEDAVRVAVAAQIEADAREEG